jgi:tetratricopeptide (TPR) repeat protein
VKIDDLRKLRDDYFEEEEYLKSMDQCVELAAKHGEELTFDDIFKKGLCHFKLEEDAEATGCFNKALEKEPDNVMALTNKGICLYNLGRFQEAFEIFNRAVKINPNVFPPYYYIGMYYMRIFQETGDLQAMEKLVNAYRPVLAQAPDFGPLLMYDPNKDADYTIDLFLMLHDDVKEMSIDELTAL